jgi:hypothetical protein
MVQVENICNNPSSTICRFRVKLMGRVFYLPVAAVIIIAANTLVPLKYLQEYFIGNNITTSVSYQGRTTDRLGRGNKP